VCNLQPADECEGDNFLPIVGDFGELTLKEIEVRLETVPLPHFDREESVAAPLCLLAGGILGKEYFSHLSEIVEEWGESE